MMFMSRALEEPRSLRKSFLFYLFFIFEYVVGEEVLQKGRSLFKCKRGVVGSRIRRCLAILSFCLVRGERVIVWHEGLQM